VDESFDITFTEPSAEGAPASPSGAPAALAPAANPQFSEDDLGAALSGLERRKDTASPITMAAPFSPTDSNYGRALARLLVKKGLIEEAELLAELSKE
jgi:hypothetical protein